VLENRPAPEAMPNNIPPVLLACLRHWNKLPNHIRTVVVALLETVDFPPDY
jgi:hypothetical protein